MDITEHEQKVFELEHEAIVAPEAIPLASFFKILSDPTRVKIILALGSTSLSVNEISTIIAMSQSSVSHQLRILKDHNFVLSERFGQQIHYTLTDRHILTILNCGLEHIKE